ncbi:hypothetical protein MNEG_15504 [Monoraphidium neglectum]|uniref:Uncharacterized protein n=1 Tax=Monoraphidium neglectum TaxID=145388 RepID=A0A0D2LKK5_9CHLO|nr:hypothetical protein MNEG_15504 [Monoraphidium neglectum]KIY92459.1 hypothetical protein MNEG_15504 [Monoraphidium neglectum]|eukprot:XP_013891479.1 hypothetical protein MNEG_15504 [Monoraphidium neglectum]
MPPRVLFGTRTSDPAALSDARPMRQHAREQGAAIAHATVEAADGGSCLRFARTLVFTHGAVASIPGVDPGAPPADGPDPIADGALLMRWYAAAADAAHAAMTHFATKPDATVSSARVAARNALISAAHAARLPLVVADVASQLKFALWAWDCEAAMPAQDEPCPHDGRPKTLRLGLGGIRGGGGAVLGSVVYADTFIEPIAAVPAALL